MATSPCPICHERTLGVPAVEFERGRSKRSTMHSGPQRPDCLPSSPRCKPDRTRAVDPAPAVEAQAAEGTEGEMSELDAQHSEAVATAIANLCGAAMVTRWVVVAEVVSNAGTIGLADCTSPGMPYWDFAGMLTSALQGREAQPMWSYDPDDEDDE